MKDFTNLELKEIAFAESDFLRKLDLGFYQTKNIKSSNVYIVKGKLFIQYVCESLKVDSELRAVQPFPKSPHIEAVVRVVKHINSYSLLVESAISDSEILVEFENDVTYKKDDVIFFEGELSFEFL